MKIAIDLDNTITADKNSIEFFEILTNLLIAEHRIYILTNRNPGSEQDIANELDCLGIEYSEIVITANKAEYIKENNVNIFFEDTDEYFLELGEEVVVFKIRVKYSPLSRPKKFFYKVARCASVLTFNI